MSYKKWHLCFVRRGIVDACAKHDFAVRLLEVLVLQFSVAATVLLPVLSLFARNRHYHRHDKSIHSANGCYQP